MLIGGCFQPKKPIFRAFFGVVHPPTPHPPIFTISVHKIHIPQPLIPTPFPLHSKNPYTSTFFAYNLRLYQIAAPRVPNYTIRTTYIPKNLFLVIRAKRKKRERATGGASELNI